MKIMFCGPVHGMLNDNLPIFHTVLCEAKDELIRPCSEVLENSALGYVFVGYGCHQQILLSLPKCHFPSKPKEMSLY